MTSPDSVLTGSYDHILVALSVLIAILASYAALDLARHVTSAQGRARLLWLTGGASAMGFGIWSMHYIGMLAFRLPIPVQYDWPTVLLSLLAAILASAIALFVVSRSRMGVIRAVLGSIFMGGGIATMHYTGMAAMRLPAICSYSTGLVTLSVLLAIVISLVALFLTFYFRGDTTAWSWRKMLSAMVMGAAIPVMHYTAMAAASFTPSNSDHHDLSHAVSVSSLGVAGICIVTFVVLGTYLLTSLRFDAVSTGSSVLSGLFYRRATLVLTVVVVITSAGMLWQLNRLQTNLVRAMALQGSFLQSQTIAALRSMYTSEVVERVRPLGIEATGDYKEKRGAIPLPATFTIELGQHIHESGSGMDMRLYSDYPFPWRKDGGPQDAFEREALIRLRENPDVPFFRMESLRGTMVIRYATADRMRKQCLDCHNNHPASPKRDWKEGEVRGVLEVIRPLSPVIAQTRSQLAGTVTLFLFFSVSGAAVLGMAFRKLYRTSTELEQQVADRKRAEQHLAQRAEELARSNAELELFAYVASHDLQEPLRMVASYTQLLARRYMGKLGGEADEFIGFAVDGATRMQQLIQDLLSYSRLTTKGKAFNFTQAEVACNSALENLHASIKESNAQVSIETLPGVFADATQLTQLFQNLIGNAIKYRNERRPEIRVAAKPNGNEWTFSVQDNGIGIEPQYSERIFQMFQRLHTRAEYSGTGIGLAVCRKIVERHGGRIWVESQPGKGSIFLFTIPRVEERTAK